MAAAVLSCSHVGYGSWSSRLLAPLWCYLPCWCVKVIRVPVPCPWGACWHPSCCKARYSSDVWPPAPNQCQHDPGDAKAHSAATVEMLGSELSSRRWGPLSFARLLRGGWPRAWPGVRKRWDSCIGMDLARDLSDSVPVYSWGFLFLSCTKMVHFSCVLAISEWWETCWPWITLTSAKNICATLCPSAHLILLDSLSVSNHSVNFCSFNYIFQVF